MVDQRSLDEAAEALAIEILADPRHADAVEATAREMESEAARLDLAIAEAEKRCRGSSRPARTRRYDSLSLRHSDPSAG